jgi:serine/threonine protein kinase
LLTAKVEIRLELFPLNLSRLADGDLMMGHDRPTINIDIDLHITPEMDEGCYDQKVDVYSFGLIMYEIVTSHSIFSSAGDDKRRLFWKLYRGWRPSIDESVKSLSRNIIERCWSLNARDLG